MAVRSSLNTLSMLLVFFILCRLAYGRVIMDRPSAHSDLISYGVHDDFRRPSLLRLKQLYASDSCDQTYGFMPCTTTALGNLFLIIVYGYLTFLAATYLSKGSELLLETLGPGIIGGLFLPVLGALPDAMLILVYVVEFLPIIYSMMDLCIASHLLPSFSTVSGLSGGTETAQSQVSVGMGLLAGSTVMLLTVIWGTCVVVGKCDLQGPIATDGKDTKTFSLIGSGVTTDIWTSYAARIMAVSVIPFIVVQLPQFFHSTSGKHLAVLIALIISLLLLVSYCLYQVFQPWIQRRRLAYVKHKRIILAILKHLRMHSRGRFLKDDGKPNPDIIGKLFKMIDGNGDGFISVPELRAFIVGARFEEINLNEDAAVDEMMKDFDKSHDSRIDPGEFFNGISKWLEEAKQFGVSFQAQSDMIKYLTDIQEHIMGENDLLGEQSDKVVEKVENPTRTSFKAVLLLLLGTVIVAVFADPLVDAVDNFSSATSIPSFFISFIVLPMATNTSEAVSAVIFSSRKNQRSASLTFSELYGSATMNNVLCLSVFLALVYIRGLAWDFSSEVLIILIVCIVMGAFASFRTTFPLWTSLVAFLLYPFSLVLVYVLDYILGWS